MVKIYTSSFGFDYSFPAVCLAYVLRYPNPYSTHVQSIDTLEKSFDAERQELTTTRLLLKRSKIPSAVLELLPKRAGAAADSQTYVLEKSVVNIEKGWMHTESRNLEWTGVLSVVEDQHYERVGAPIQEKTNNNIQDVTNGKTNVFSTVTLQSHFGEAIKKHRNKSSDGIEADGDEPPKMGFLRSFTTSSVQKSIELLGLKRTRGSQPKAMAGMNVVLERLHTGGLVAVLEGMRRDSQLD